MNTKLIIDSRIKISKNSLSYDQIKQLKQAAKVKNPVYYDELTFNGWVNPSVPEYYTVFEEDHSNILLPRGMLEKTVDIVGDSDVEYKTSHYEPLGLQLTAPMEERDYQNNAVNALLESDTGILVAPTGSGKTNIMIKLIHKLDQPTLILVHRYHLVNQWKKRIEHYLGYKVGIIGEGVWKVKNITVAMIPTLHVHNKRMRELRKRFGLVIIDECHHIPAFTWISNIVHLGADKIYGCSATPRRKDGLQKLMFLTIGPVLHVLQDSAAVHSGAIMPVEVRAVRTSYEGPFVSNKRDFQTLANDIILDKKRNSLITNKIVEEAGHAQIVLSDRINHLKLLQSLLEKKSGLKVALVIGETSANRRQEIFSQIENREINVLLASSVADEGLDIPILDRLHLCFPTANPDRNMQQIGRIRRPSKDKKDAVVFDYFDWKHPTLNRQFQRRKARYRQNHFQLNFIGELK